MHRWFYFDLTRKREAKQRSLKDFLDCPITIFNNKIPGKSVNHQTDGQTDRQEAAAAAEEEDGNNNDTEALISLLYYFWYMNHDDEHEHGPWIAGREKLKMKLDKKNKKRKKID